MGSRGVGEVVDARGAQVRKILESRTFQNTEVLKRLLDYLAHQAIENPTVDLKEYTIGVEAFGKPADYAPQVDSLVRVQTGKLRHKLDEYYRVEGSEDDWIVELPKGHFRLEFHPRPAPSAPAVEPPTAQPSRFPRWIWWAAASAVLLAVTLPLLLRHRASAAGAWTPAMEELWQPFLSSPRPVLIAVGAPMFVKIGNDFFRDPTLNAWDPATPPEEIDALERAVGAKAAFPVFNYTGIGEAEGLLQVASLLVPHGRELAMRSSHQLSWDDIGRYNMIFLGPPKYNQQTLDLPVRQDFEIGHARVQNLNPLAGEPRTFEEKWTADRATLEEGHALISRLPGLHGVGEMLILAGSSTESTRAAAEFVTRPEYVAHLVRRIHEAGTPQWFQAVIHTRFKSQVPIAIDLSAFHPLKGR